MAVCRSRTTVLLLLLAVLPHLIQAVGDYARTVSYADEMVVRCPDKNKATVQVLRDHSDVWHVGKESIDMRVRKSVFARVQRYFPECVVQVSDLEAHMQEAEKAMFPRKKAEQEAWEKAVVQAMLPKNDLQQCEEERARIQDSMAMEKSWFDEYHDYEEIVNWYRVLANTYPDLVRFVPSIGQTFEKRDMPAIHFTGPTSSTGKKRFYIQCQIHAREWISGATCMYLAKYFMDGYGVLSRVTHLMDNLEIILVPFVNPDGYVYTWTNDRMWRKNRHRNPSDATCVGVDINRNFPEGYQHTTDSCAEDYGGPRAKSELETQHVINYFKSHTPIIGSIDFHSYGELLLRPWGKSNTTTPDEAFHTQLGNDMVNQIKKVHGTVYTSEHSYDLYFCYGIAADWFYSDDANENNDGYRSASFCIELRDTGNDYGFALPADQILPTAEEIMPGVLLYMERVLDQPLTQPRHHTFSQNFWQRAEQILKEHIRQSS